MEENAAKTPEEPSAAPRRRRRWPWFAAAAVLAALFCAFVFLPSLLVLWGEIAYSRDFGPDLPIALRDATASRTVEAKGRFSRDAHGGLAFSGEGAAFDIPFVFDSLVDWCPFSFSLSATGTVLFAGDGPAIAFNVSWSAFDGWKAEIESDEFRFGRGDGALGDLARRIVLSASGADGFDLSGKCRLKCAASDLADAPAPAWTADAWLSDVSAAFEDGEDSIVLSGGKVHAAAEGYAGRVEIRPMFPRAGEIEVSGFKAKNAFASVRATESAYLVTEAGADVLGGTARVYALFLRPDKLDAGFTLMLEDIDAAEALSLVSGFEGEAEGKLHGLVNLRVSGGSEIVLGDAYLHSYPGEKGRLAMRNAAGAADGFAFAGLSGADRDNVAKALSDMTYDVISLKLAPDREDEGCHKLSFKLSGSAGEGKKAVPVSIALNVNGRIQDLLNTGLKAANMKGEPK